MFTITNEKPENYQLNQGKQIMSDINNKKKNNNNIIVGLEQGSLQSHETNSQVLQRDAVHSKNQSLDYGRIMDHNKLQLNSANVGQGNIFNNLFDTKLQSDDAIKANGSDSEYQKNSIEGMIGIEPLHLVDNSDVPSDQAKNLQALENQFNSVLSTYITTYKTMNEDIVNRRDRLRAVNKYFGKAVSDNDENFYYVNDYGYTHKYASDAWVKNDKSCPNNLTNITKNELEILQDSVAMEPGQPCKIAGKNVQNKATNEVAWVDIKGVKHVYSDISWKGKQKSCNIKPIVLSDDKYNMIPSGSNMTTTTVCDELGVDPNIWIQLSELNKNLIEISKKIQTEMGNVRTQDDNMKKQIIDKSVKLNNYIKTLEKEKEKIKNNDNINMATLQAGYDDSVLNLRQKSYRYLAWTYVALAGGFVLARAMVKRR